MNTDATTQRIQSIDDAVKMNPGIGPLKYATLKTGEYVTVTEAIFRTVRLTTDGATKFRALGKRGYTTNQMLGWGDSNITMQDAQRLGLSVDATTAKRSEYGATYAAPAAYPFVFGTGIVIDNHGGSGREYGETPIVGEGDLLFIEAFGYYTIHETHNDNWYLLPVAK